MPSGTWVAQLKILLYFVVLADVHYDRRRIMAIKAIIRRRFFWINVKLSWWEYSFQFSPSFCWLLWWRLALITLWNSSLIVYFSQVVPTFLHFLTAKLVNKINNSFENVIISGEMKKVSECRVRRFEKYIS